MSPDALLEDIAGLLELWVAGWAGSRGYDTRNEGRFPAALRSDKTGDWEYFAHDPSEAEFAALAAKTAESESRILTVLTNDAALYTELARRYGLNITSDSQTMMFVDMETQDSEDPWLSDDDLKLTTSKRDGVHYAVVRDGQKLAASGQVFVVEHTAVFDKIVTEPDYQRRGLGSFIMKALAARAFEHDVENGLLLASLDGQHLYSHLGWNHVCQVLMMSSTPVEETDISLA
ncbi:GNAT family N-acetyltransferase [bacterium RCC_150]